MRTLKLGLAIILLSAFCTAAPASVTIDFGPSLPGAPTGYKTILTNQLAGYGITFSTTDSEGVSWFGPGYPWTGAHYSIAAGDLGAVEFVDPIRVDFSTYATEASIRGFNGGGDTDTLILKAFDSSDAVVDSTSITAVFGTPGRVASVSASEIAYITFEVSVAGDHGLFFDDLKFTAADVPEPSTLAIFSGLLGMAVIGQVWRRRRR